MSTGRRNRFPRPRPAPGRGKRPTECHSCGRPLGLRYRDRLCPICLAANPRLQGLGQGSTDPDDVSCLFGYDPAFDGPDQLSLDDLPGGASGRGG